MGRPFKITKRQLPRSYGTEHQSAHGMKVCVSESAAGQETNLASDFDLWPPSSEGLRKYLTSTALLIMLQWQTNQPESKGKVPPGCLLAEPVTHGTRFSMTLGPSLGTVPLCSALSQLHSIRCVAQLYWHHGYPSEKCQTKLTDLHSHPDKIPVLLPESCTILQGLHIPHIAVMTKDQACNPQMREQAVCPTGLVRLTS